MNDRQKEILSDLLLLAIDNARCDGDTTLLNELLALQDVVDKL